MKKSFLFVFVYIGISVLTSCQSDAKLSGYAELDAWAQRAANAKSNIIGYPCNMNIELEEFYKWYMANGIENMMLNNAGDPFVENSAPFNAGKFEKEVIEFFAPYYGWSADECWGITTTGGTDGNNHGIYFGVNYLQRLTGEEPIVYVSDEAHYSNIRLADLQNLEIRLVKSDLMGRMIPQELEKALDEHHPCLIIYAFGSTFRGAIDNIDSLNAVLARHPQMPVYRHVDAALFGGYLPFTQYRNMLDCRLHPYESVAVSGHKFFGMDEPAGYFITSRRIYDQQKDYNIPYLNENMRMIGCSRAATTSLKFWWLIHKVGAERWQEQAEAMLANTQYLKQRLDEIGWPCWVNEYSNTIFFKRPCQAVVDKYVLACNFDEQFGGELAHIVVMQHVDQQEIDRFIADLQTMK